MRNEFVGRSRMTNVGHDQLTVKSINVGLINEQNHGQESYISDEHHFRYLKNKAHLNLICSESCVISSRRSATLPSKPLLRERNVARVTSNEKSFSSGQVL